MDKKIEDVIMRVYKSFDYDYYRRKCMEELPLPKNLVVCIKEIAKGFVEELDGVSPSRRWYIEYNDYIDGNFNVFYRTIVQISKIAPVFYIQHEFEVENKDIDAINPILEGFSCEPYTKSQATIHEKIVNILGKNGYGELSYSQMNEVITDLRFPKGVTIFGPQVTVEYALFNDILGLSD